MNLIQRYSFYINLYSKLKQTAATFVEEQEKKHKNEVRTRTKTWLFQDMYIIRDVHDLKYDWHTVQIDNKKDGERITEFDGLPANIFLNRLQKSK